MVDGVDFGATGEVKRIDIVKIRERLDKNCIVMLSNLGYSSNGEVLNCKQVSHVISVFSLLRCGRTPNKNVMPVEMVLLLR